MLFRNISLLATLALLGSVASEDAKSKTPGNKAPAKDSPPKNDPKEKKTTQLTPDSAAADFKNVDCKTLTVAELAALKDYKACAGLTADCMKSFNITNINAECLANVPSAQLRKLPKDSLRQLVSSDPEVMQLTSALLDIILDHLGMTRDTAPLPSDFTKYVVQTNDLLKAVFNRNNVDLLLNFLNAETIPRMDLSFFRRIGPGVVAVLPDDAFSKITSEQLYLIPEESMAEMSAAKIAKIPPAAMARLTAHQVEKIKTEALNALSSAQIANFGADPLAIPRVQAKAAAARNDEILTRRQFLDKHPCSTVMNKEGLSQKIKSELGNRCQAVVRAQATSDSSRSYSSTAAIALLAVLPALLL